MSGAESAEVSQLMDAVVTGDFMAVILRISSNKARVRRLFVENSLFFVEQHRRFSRLYCVPSPSSIF
jgi:hypothetical protein